MRKPVALLAGMALSALVLIGLTVTADKSSASFTAVTDNPGNSFGSATLSASNDKLAAGTLVSLTNIVPGDTAARTVQIQNTGNVGFTYTAASSATANTLLWSDTTNGIQVNVKRAGASIYNGPLKNLTFTSGGTIAAGANDNLTMDFSFPTAAGNGLQTQTGQDFTITYTATQLAGTTR